MTNAALSAPGANLVILVALQLVACSSGGGSSSESNPVDPPVANRPPVISGSPALFVTRDQAFLFAPTASDPDQDPLIFSISNRPAWASFDEMTGTLSGTPDASNIGTTQAIGISVSDGMATASLAPFDLEVQQVTLGTATVSWDIPTTNADGTTLTDLAGFRVHYGTTSQTYTLVAETKNKTANFLLIDNLEPGTHFFAVTAFDLSDNESLLSSEVSKVIAP